MSKIEDAIDKLMCMSNEILIEDSLKKMNPILADSRQKENDV